MKLIRTLLIIIGLATVTVFALRYLIIPLLLML